jgi:hypothetical protein
VVRREEQLLSIGVVQQRRDQTSRVHFLDRFFPASDEEAPERLPAEPLQWHRALPAQLRSGLAHHLGCLEGCERARVDAAEHGDTFVVYDPAQDRIARSEHRRATGLVDAALFAREQVPDGHGLSGLDRENLPDAHPGALLREKPLALAGAEAGATLLEEPGHDRAALDLEAVDGPRTEELHCLRRVGEVVGRARPRFAETPLRVSPHLRDEALVLRVHRRRRDLRCVRVPSLQAALLVLLAGAAGAGRVAPHFRRGRRASLVLREQRPSFVRYGEADREPVVACP